MKKVNEITIQFLFESLQMAGFIWHPFLDVRISLFLITARGGCAGSIQLQEYVASYIIYKGHIRAMVQFRVLVIISPLSSDFTLLELRAILFEILGGGTGDKK